MAAEVPAVEVAVARLFRGRDSCAFVRQLLVLLAERNPERSVDGNVTGQKAQGPLVGLKVIDLSHVMAGPTCSMLLADMGADVIKVEKLQGGDDSRRMVPPKISEESAAFLIMNRNKRGIALDLRQRRGARSYRACCRTRTY